MTGSFGKPDATGRSSGKRSGRARKLRSPPKGEPWVWLTRELVESPAWGALNLTSRKLIDFLLIEYMAHAGTENGALVATHGQLGEFGLSRRLISDAVEECVFLGLLRVQQRGGLSWGGMKRPSLYRLTFYPDKDDGPPTNEWKGKTEEAITEWRRDRRRLRARKKIPAPTLVHPPHPQSEAGAE